MPLPLGHTAIGLTVNDFCSKNNSTPSRWIFFGFIALLANLPDMDILIGLLFHGNGNIYHRGPSHSILFALLLGFAASKAWKLSTQIPKIHFLPCFMIIFSHVAADFLLSHSAVSFFWPLEVNWAAGYRGWSDVIHLIFLGALRDAGIIIICGVAIMFNRLVTQFRRHGIANHGSGEIQ